MPSEVLLAIPMISSDADTRPCSFWLWPNLLSLDAPLVALVWQVLFAKAFHAGSGALPAVLLVLAVWLIYAADRTLDAWAGKGVEPRHEFYRRHWRGVLPFWAAALAVAGWLAWTRLPASIFRHGALMMAAVAVYFAAVHLAPERLRRVWPKEALVATLFALGASLAAWTRIATTRSTGDVVSILLFGCLCWINCVAVERWERRKFQGWPVGAAAAAVGVAALLLPFLNRPLIGGAETASACALLLLDHGRRRFSADALRVLADAALLSPVFFLPLFGVFV